MLKSRLDIVAEFASAIEALGGRIRPMLVHDDPIQVDVPKGARLRAEALIDKLRADLEVQRESPVLQPCLSGCRPMSKSINELLAEFAKDETPETRARD